MSYDPIRTYANVVKILLGVDEDVEALLSRSVIMTAGDVIIKYGAIKIEACHYTDVSDDDSEQELGLLLYTLLPEFIADELMRFEDDGKWYADVIKAFLGSDAGTQLDMIEYYTPGKARNYESPAEDIYGCPAMSVQELQEAYDMS